MPNLRDGFWTNTENDKRHRTNHPRRGAWQKSDVKRADKAESYEIKELFVGTNRGFDERQRTVEIEGHCYEIEKNSTPLAPGRRNEGQVTGSRKNPAVRVKEESENGLSKGEKRKVPRPMLHTMSKLRAQ